MSKQQGTGSLQSEFYLKVASHSVRSESSAHVVATDDIQAEWLLLHRCVAASTRVSAQSYRHEGKGSEAVDKFYVDSSGIHG